MVFTSIYWPDPSQVSWNNGRSTYNSSRIAILSNLGKFTSSDDLTFMSTDYGSALQRRLNVDIDGNLRLYSREKSGDDWVVSWQAFSEPCMVHGICGPNAVCSSEPSLGGQCSCIPGYKMKNQSDWSLGCEPEFNFNCSNGHDDFDFLPLSDMDFYGYDFGFYPNYTLQECKNLCLKLCCKGFQYKVNGSSHNCYPKTTLLNGFRTPSFPGILYLKLPKSVLSLYSTPDEEFHHLECPDKVQVLEVPRIYLKNHANRTVEVILWFACVIGGIEIFCILFVWGFITVRNRRISLSDKKLVLTATGFKRFTYAELKKVTRGFKEEIGRGSGGVVYKGTLSDRRVAAIKQLNEATQGEGEFLAEAGTIGRLNHMNLIEMWGYCAEGKHRLLVYEYMEHGSLADNLTSEKLDSKKRFEIAVGMAKGLAYLHEECLEWILHCDVKPQNILINANYQPKVADFGLSKLQNRGELHNSNFSRSRGTRGYMAPEWVYNLPITSKVDVYSYGMVVLELVTGKSPTAGFQGSGSSESGGTEHRMMVRWIREKLKGETEAKMVEIVDPMLGEYESSKMEILVKVALQCAEEDRNQRPSMGQVVEMLLCHENS